MVLRELGLGQPQATTTAASSNDVRVSGFSKMTALVIACEPGRSSL
jgi:hypothetical protein